MSNQQPLGVGSGMPSEVHHRPDTLVCHRRAVERVIAAMYDHLEDSFSLDDMADVAIMSPFHFNRTFRQLTGLPPRQYLSAVRLQAAKRLLLTTEMSVTDVCFEVGYNSLGTFIRRFTGLVGLSPRRLRSVAHVALTAGVLRTGGAPPCDEAVATLTGNVTARQSLSGPIFVGLFSRPIPEGRPVACTVVDAPGPYRIESVPDGTFFLFAAAVPGSNTLAERHLYEAAPRAGGNPVAVVCGNVIRGSTDLMLRDADPLDPPILMAPAVSLADRSRDIQATTHARKRLVRWLVKGSHGARSARFTQPENT